MKMLQHCFAYGLMLSFLNLFSMDLMINVFKNNIDWVADIRDEIDEEHLKIDRNACFRRFSGMFLSWYKPKQLTYEQAIQEIQKIESYIPSSMTESNRKKAFDLLIAHHWYVHYLRQSLMNCNMTALECVRGSTIDNLYYNIDESLAQINASVRQQFFNEHINKKLIDIVPSNIEGIHFTVLYEYDCDEIKPFSLVMSSDSKYVRIAKSNYYMTWEMETGKKINELDDFKRIETDKTRQWICGRMYCDDRKNSLLGMYDHHYEERYQVFDREDTYCAAVVDIIGNEKFAHNHKAIVLFKRPQRVSYLCEKAFNNYRHHSGELLQLLQSKAFNEVKGFPKINLENCIKERIELLKS